jgi:hypothetical protein
MRRVGGVAVSLSHRAALVAVALKQVAASVCVEPHFAGRLHHGRNRLPASLPNCFTSVDLQTVSVLVP